MNITALCRRRAWMRKAGFFLVDIVLVLMAYASATAFRFLPSIPPEQINRALRCLLWIMFSYAAALLLSRTYNVLWAYASIRDTLRVAWPLAAASAWTLTLNMTMRWQVSGAALAMTGFLSISLCCGIRLIWQMRHGRIRMGQKDTERCDSPILIVGAGEGASYAIQLCHRKCLGKPVAMVDDDPLKQNLFIQNVPVRGYLDEIPKLLKRYQIREVIVAILALKEDKLDQVVSAAHAAKCQIRMLCYLADAKPKSLARLGFRKLNISDFLPREEVQLNDDKISGYLREKTVLVTGGGGSIGSELCRQIMRFSPGLLLIFDIYENCAYELQCELTQHYGPDCPQKVLIGSVQDKRRVDEIMETYHPHVLFHAAAHKHVPLMEENPAEAVKNNVQGTFNMLQSASQHGVECFVALSSDKAVNPINVMGATKRLTEMLVQFYAKHTSVKCMAVRFGNVLGSHGSVIPLFESQIQRGGPVTVTHPDIERFFMTIPEAAQLVLQAGSLAQSGAIYMLDMGRPVKIMDLAEKLIRFYGYTSGQDIEVRVVGLRPGEKLQEELLTEVEVDMLTKTEHSKIFMAPPIPLAWPQFREQLEELFRAAERNNEAVVEALERIVPTYRPKRLKLTG